MGTVIKFILILIVVLYLINKVGKFFYELFFPDKANMESKQHRQHNTTNEDYREGESYVNHNKSQVTKNFKGGDYVDFEEIE